MNENKKTAADRAAAAPTALHVNFAKWLTEQTGVEVDVKTVQLACIFRMEFQASPENQKDLAARKAKAAAAKKASAARKKAKLEAELAKLKAVGEKFNEEKANGATDEEAREEVVKAEPKAEPAKLTVVYGGMGEPQVHKFGCADIKKLTRAKGYSKETAEVSSHTELTHLIYSDMIDSGESSLEDNYMAYDAKPCCPALDN